CCAKKYEIGEFAERGDEPVCGFRRQVFGTFQAHGQVETPVRYYPLGYVTTNQSVGRNAKVLSWDPISLIPKDIMTSIFKQNREPRSNPATNVYCRPDGPRQNESNCGEYPLRGRKSSLVPIRIIIGLIKEIGHSIWHHGRSH